jgi:hypothetical protein
MGADLMPDLKYTDPETGYEWMAHFETEAEATAQAVEDTLGYGGVAPQEVVDDQGATLVAQQAIVDAAEAERAGA